MLVGRTFWSPRKRHDAVATASSNAVRKVREDAARRWRDSQAARELEGSLISLAALIGTDVTNPDGEAVGQLRDVVVRWTSRTSHPAVTAIVVRASGHNTVIGAHWVEMSSSSGVRLRAHAAYARGAQRRPGEVLLAHDVLDRQVVGADGVDIVRPADVYLAAVKGGIELIGIEVGVRALLRRLGSKRRRGRVRPARVIDWATIRSFTPVRDDGTGHRGRRSDLAGATGTGLRLNVAAEELSALRAAEVEAALHQSDDESEGPSP
ncbi:MAG TPA: hypothetical protein VKG82_04720 [Solirubrobacteraceae bacterium]|nr:hypothetical protein [Solirubrobacteraceae bacterium]